MPLDALITGRIATLAGETGFGWVEALGIRAGRVAFAGTEVALEHGSKTLMASRIVDAIAAFLRGSDE